ncbi:MAG TPA: hypothetical protein ENI08_00295 [Candidatus Dependentiae bacterium]|nr:hypothetical protein [Candidatus Dependentiae bacterium]
MNNIKLSSENNTQLTISYELLYLLQWLIEYDDSRLKQMITRALNQGLRKEMQKTEKSNELVDEMCYHTIIDFFELMEELLAESIEEHIEKKAREKNLMPAIDQIDSTVCDDATMLFSIERTTTKIENDPNINPKEQLFKELLRSWKPHNKNTMN